MGISGLVSAVGAIAQGSAQAKASNFNAAVAQRNAQIQRNNAELSRQQTSQKIKDRREEYRRLHATNIARAGATGLELSGSFLDVGLDNLATAEMDAANIDFQGQIEEMNFLERAAGFDIEAGMERNKAKSAMTSGYINAIGAGIGAGASIYGSFGSSAGGTAPDIYKSGSLGAVKSSGGRGVTMNFIGNSQLDRISTIG